MLKRPRAVLFDMGGVLSDSSESCDADAFAISFPEGLPWPAPVDWFMGMSGDCMARFLRIPPPRPAFDCRPVIAEWLRKREETPTSEEVARWLRIMERWEARPIYPFVLPTLKTLAAAGIRMGVISNTVTGAGCLREHFKKAGILDYFEYTVFSAEFGISKPDPAIFRSALDAMQLDPARTWYVGDKPQRDICGAHGVGMTALLVDSKHVGRVADAPENVPDARVSNVSELPRLIEGLPENDE